MFKAKSEEKSYSQTLYKVSFHYRRVNTTWGKKAKRKTKQRHISVVGVKLWNDVDINIKMVLVFKRMLKYILVGSLW